MRSDESSEPDSDLDDDEVYKHSEKNSKKTKKKGRREIAKLKMSQRERRTITERNSFVSSSSY